MISRRMHLPYSAGLVIATIVLARTPLVSGTILSPESTYAILLPPVIFERPHRSTGLRSQGAHSGEVGRRFRSKLATHSERSQPMIPTKPAGVDCNPGSYPIDIGINRTGRNTRNTRRLP
jgi:hypothetical protein